MVIKSDLRIIERFNKFYEVQKKEFKRKSPSFDKNIFQLKTVSKARNIRYILKSVSKVSRNFAIFVNIFRNFNAISDFYFAMNSYGYENIFQPKKLVIH